MDETTQTQSNEAPKATIQMDSASQNKLMAILAYIGPLVIVSYIVAKDDSFVKFHIKQALVLLVGWVVLWLLGSVIWGFGFFWIWSILKLGLFIFAIIGIVNAAQGKDKELPWVGQYSKYFAF